MVEEHAGSEAWECAAYGGLQDAVVSCVSRVDELKKHRAARQHQNLREDRDKIKSIS